MKATIYITFNMRVVFYSGKVSTINIKTVIYLKILTFDHL